MAKAEIASLKKRPKDSCDNFVKRACPGNPTRRVCHYIYIKVIKNGLYKKMHF